MNKKTHRRRRLRPLRDPLWGIYLGVLLLLAALVMLAGCRARVVERERTSVLRDTVRQVRLLRDTAHVRDSIFLSIRQQGETVYVDKERWRTEWRERVRTDTVYQSRTDSVSVPVPVTKTRTVTVRAPLRWWQKGLMLLGLVPLAWLGFRAWRIFRKMRGK